MSDPWLDPRVAQEQRQLADRQLQENPPPPHFRALADAVRATQCPGDVLLVGCGVGHEREVLDRAGVEYRSFTGTDISPESIRLAKERYPESRWIEARFDQFSLHKGRQADVVVDGSLLLHVDDWKGHLAKLCWASRRWVILHRVPLDFIGSLTDAADPSKMETSGYGHSFPAWRFRLPSLIKEMAVNGFVPTNPQRGADGGSMTLTFARPRVWATYCDSVYLPRLKALHASMVRHCGPLKLHVLAWDEPVAEWCRAAGISCVAIEDFTFEHPNLWIYRLPGPPRSKVEHMWTVGPAFLAWIMEKTGEPVTYVDADIMFHSSPEPVFAEIGGAPAAVVPHAFARAEQGLPGPTVETHDERFGRFNCGLVYVAARALVETWAQQCRYWCYDHVQDVAMDDGRIVKWYGDQGYLKWWPESGAHVVEHPGACAGPWAVHTRALDIRDGVIHFGNRPLVGWHYSALKLGPHGYDSLTRPEYMLSERQAEIIYAPYLRALQEAK